MWDEYYSETYSDRTAWKTYLQLLMKDTACSSLKLASDKWTAGFWKSERWKQWVILYRLRPFVGRSS